MKDAYGQYFSTEKQATTSKRGELLKEFIRHNENGAHGPGLIHLRPGFGHFRLFLPLLDTLAESILRRKRTFYNGKIKFLRKCRKRHSVMATTP